ncbi:MAG: hypothetical protein NVSMB64_05150 [Candidatus Velthaea sp.]
MQRFIGGFVTAFIVLAVAGFIAVKFGLVPAAADQKPPKIEAQIAHMSLNARVDRESPQPPYPYQSSDATVLAGAKLYMQHCAMCHGSGVGDETMLAKGQYIHPPQFAKHGVDDDPEGLTYWKVEHGVRWTGMPAYKDSLTEKEIWEVADFLHVPADKLPASAAAEFNKPATE